jgi:hypothetical protein
LIAACQGSVGKTNAHAISLDAVTTTVVAGGPAITLTANVEGAADSVTWQLAGPGVLAKDKGPSTAYSPPACATQAASATVTASAAGANASVTLDIQPAPGANCLSVSPSDAEVTIGDGTVTLTADVRPADAEVTWSVLGPGSLSTTKGSATVYTPPDELANEVPLVVTITASTSSAAVARTQVRVNPRWMLNTNGTAGALAFDGANVWVHVKDRGPRLLKVRASDGTLQGVFPVPAPGLLMLAQGSSLWLAYQTENYKGHIVNMRTSDGAILADTQLDTPAASLTSDGDSIWFSDWYERIGRVRASDGQFLGYMTATGNPVVYEGDSIWAYKGGDVGALTRIRISDGANLGNLYVGRTIVPPMADGSGRLWLFVTSSTNYQLLRVSATTGAILDTTTLRESMTPVFFDGDYIWTVEGPIKKRRLSDLEVVKTYTVNSAAGFVSDGVHVWVSSSYGGFLTRL